jgi:hypothetical protein
LLPVTRLECKRVLIPSQKADGIACLFRGRCLRLLVPDAVYLLHPWSRTAWRRPSSFYISTSGKILSLTLTIC